MKYLKWSWAKQVTLYGVLKENYNSKNIFLNMFMLQFEDSAPLLLLSIKNHLGATNNTWHFFGPFPTPPPPPPPPPFDNYLYLLTDFNAQFALNCNLNKEESTFWSIN